MKILIADKFEQSGLLQLQRLGCEVAFEPDLSGDALAQRIREWPCEVLVVRSTPVPRQAIEAGRTLSLVVRAGSGVNTIDTQAASDRGIYVANCPGMNAAAVAELVFGLMISLDRRIAHNITDLREGTWNKEDYSRARGLKGSTLGIVGFGAVGREVAARAHSFGMRVIYYDIVEHPNLPEIGAVERLPLEEVQKQSDWVTLHIPLNPQTRHLVDERMLRMMKPSAHLINTSRSEVIDPAALIRALDQGWIAGAGLDVYELEPVGPRGSFADPVVQFKELYGTHHIGASTEQAQEAVAMETVRIIRTYVESGEVPNCVNVDHNRYESFALVLRHINRPGLLAFVCGELASENINIYDMSNVVLSGAGSCCAHLALDRRPSPAVLERINQHELVLSTRLINLE